MVRQAHFCHDKLLTAVFKIEPVINSNILQYISSTDFNKPLIPFHVVIGRRLLNLPDHLGCLWGPADKDFKVNISQLMKMMKHQTSVLNHFWKHWRSEYLNKLRESHRYSARKTKHHLHISEVKLLLSMMKHCHVDSGSFIKSKSFSLDTMDCPGGH